MDSIVLNLGLREGGVECRIKAYQIVGAVDKNVLYTPVFQGI